MQIKVKGHIDFAHQIIGHEGKCQNLHGHSGKYTVTIETTIGRPSYINELGMLIDFQDIKKYMKIVEEKYDHKYLNEIYPFSVVNPTAENVSLVIYNYLSYEINNDNIEVKSVEFFESDDCSAIAP